ncbi:SapB/AmfS family lanthipeptide [Streptomyces syringium]
MVLLDLQIMSRSQDEGDHGEEAFAAGAYSVANSGLSLLLCPED